jgi:hypothetical protein
MFHRPESLWVRSGRQTADNGPRRVSASAYGHIADTGALNARRSRALILGMNSTPVSFSR